MVDRMKEIEKHETGLQSLTDECSLDFLTMQRAAQ